jgi:Uma2 family endonuclease
MKMSAFVQELGSPRLSAADYLAQERHATEKHEFVDGVIYAMAGASERHVTLTTNLVIGLGNQFKGRPCKVYANDLRVNISASTDYVYPDVVALCGDARFSDEDNLLNPVLIVEVLSDSTEAYDRGMKFEHYRRLESLQDYVLVAQDRYYIEHYQRQPGNVWLLREITALEDTVELLSVNARLTMAEIYDKVFNPPFQG